MIEVIVMTKQRSILTRLRSYVHSYQRFFLKCETSLGLFVGTRDGLRRSWSFSVLDQLDDAFVGVALSVTHRNINFVPLSVHGMVFLFMFLPSFPSEHTSNSHLPGSSFVIIVLANNKFCWPDVCCLSLFHVPTLCFLVTLTLESCDALETVKKVKKHKHVVLRNAQKRTKNFQTSTGRAEELTIMSWIYKYCVCVLAHVTGNIDVRVMDDVFVKMRCLQTFCCSVHHDVSIWSDECHFQVARKPKVVRPMPETRQHVIVLFQKLQLDLLPAPPEPFSKNDSHPSHQHTSSKHPMWCSTCFSTLSHLAPSANHRLSVTQHWLATFLQFPHYGAW